MMDVTDDLKSWGDGLPRSVTRLQPYHLKVLGANSAAGLSVVSFEATERLGEPYSVKIRLTHPMDLDRVEYVRRDATFSINPGDGSEPRQFSGCIFRFSKTRQTRDFCAYEMELRPKVALLTLTKASRVYQRKTAPQIIEAILRRHGLEGHQFAFKIRRQYPEHPFRLQYQMSDWDYIRLLMEQEGLYSYFLPSPHGAVFGDVFQVCDDIDHYIYQPELRVPYRETAGLESGIETVFDIQTHVHTVPESFRTADYNPADAYERKAGEANVARKETGNYGQSYVYGTHHLDMAGAKWEAQLRHEAALAGQIVYEGQSNVLGLRPARILRMDINLPDAPHGQVITEVVHIGARDQAYRNTYKAIPSDRRFRLPIDESRWPRIAGTLSGRVTSPGKYKYAYLTQHGLYVVRLDLDFEDWPNGGESVPMRLAKPFAGARQTGFHFPLIDGTEVAIAFRDGDPNKPYIAHAHHHSRHEDLITNRDRWLSRNVIRTQANNKLRFEDWEGQEGVKLSTDYGGKTQLNMGYLVDHKRQKRGEGFELRTSAKGVLRAGQSMALLVHDQPMADGKQDDIAPVMKLLGNAMEKMQALSNAVQRAQADLSDLRRQSELKDEKIKDLQQAVLVLSAPDGIAAVTGGSIQQSAGETLILTAGKNIDLGASENLTAAVGEAISLFAHHNGMKLFAGEGALQAQAQTGQMELSAKQDVAITSTDGQVQVAAAKSLLLTCQGAYIKLEGGEIEIGCPGNLRVRAADFDFQQPASRSLASKLPPACAARVNSAAAAGAGVVAR